MSGSACFILEIGCEEIPARFLAAAEQALGERLRQHLEETRLLGRSGVIKTASTPRRLVAYVAEIPASQPDSVREVLGPSLKAAYDAQGKPTRAAEAFAAKHNQPVSSLRHVQQSKGEYLAAEVREPGRETVKVLVDMLPAVIGGISFPKSMYWTAKAGPFFVRPVRWIMAVLWRDGRSQLVPFEFAGVKSGTYTFGHRLDIRTPLEPPDANLDLFLEKHLVVLHTDERRRRVRDGIKVLLEDNRMRAVDDSSLEDWVVNSTEWPAPVLGEFDARYLALPREILITVMRDHQKYFAVEDQAGNLNHHFITVLNAPGDPKGLIRQGHERVLTARFADAEFFWNADQKISLADRIPMLERVTYQAKLGTYADKVRRMKAIAENICVSLEEVGRLTPAQRAHTLRAVELCKCDLTTQMVQEFTELQGIMGGLYAKAQGEPPEVAEAIYDHYRPAGIEDSGPRSIVGAIVSLADKLDAVISGFAAGLEPTGSSDPFGLRRAGNGIIKVLVEVLPGLEFQRLLKGTLTSEHGHAGDVGALFDAGALEMELSAFFRERLEYYLANVVDARYDVVRAAVRSYWAWSIPSLAVELTKALDAVRDTEDFVALAAAAKRTRNILAKSAELKDFGSTNSIQPRLLASGPERELYDAYIAMQETLADHEARRDFTGAFRSLAGLRPMVDRFFDGVLVMDQDPGIRANRLALLSHLNTSVFSRLGDLAEIVPASADVGAPTSTQK